VHVRKRFSALVVMGVVVTASLGLSVPSSGAANPSPGSILKAAGVAMRAEGSMSFWEHDSAHGELLLVVTGISGQKSGSQVLTIETGVATLRRIGTNLFLHGNEQFFQDYFDIHNSPIANKWVLVPRSNGNYPSMSNGILIASAISNTINMTDLKLKGITTYNGQRAYEITGEPTTEASGAGTQTDYIATAKPNLPLGLIYRGNEGGTPLLGQFRFTKWHFAVKVQVPTKYIVATTKDLPTGS
jgi:hypothetical protein